MFDIVLNTPQPFSNFLWRSIFYFLFVTLFRIGFFIRSLPYGSQFGATWNLGSLLGLHLGPVFSQALSLYWIISGHTIQPPIEGLLLPTGIESTPFRNSASKVVGLLGSATTPWLHTFSYFHGDSGSVG